MSKHTPGPWEIENDEGVLWIWDKNLEQSITTLDSESDPHAIGNAHLIAAAPDLLETCEYLLNFIRNEQPERRTATSVLLVLSHAENIIAKAKGEGNG